MGKGTEKQAGRGMFAQEADEAAKLRQEEKDVAPSTWTTGLLQPWQQTLTLDGGNTSLGAWRLEGGARFTPLTATLRVTGVEML